MFAFVSYEYTIGICGNLLAASEGACCYNTLDPKGSAGTLSDYHAVVPPELNGKVNSIAPVGANGNSYCALATTNSTSLMNYTQLYISANNECIDGQFQCSSTGLLQVFSEPACGGTPEKIQLVSATKSYLTSSLGNFNGSLLLFQGGAAWFSWTAYTPSTLLVPSFQDPVEIVSLIAFIAGIIAGAVMLVRTSLRLFPMKGWIVATFICQVLWVVWICVRLSYWLKVFDTLFELAVWVEVIFAMLAVTTLLTTLITTKFITTVLISHWPRLAQWGMFLIPIVLHIGLGGSYYLIFAAVYSNNLPIEFVTAIRTWTTYWIYWIWAMLIWNVAPPILVSLRLVSRGDDSEPITARISKLHRIDTTLAISLTAQVIVFIGYFVMGYYKTQSDALGSDRAYNALQGFEACIFLLHASLSVRIAETVKVVCRTPSYAFSSGSGRNGSKKSSKKAKTNGSENTSITSPNESKTGFSPFGSANNDAA
jgi:hypothetical protein